MVKLFRFSSGLGNQLFQFAYFLYIRKKFRLIPDISHRLLNDHNGFELWSVFPNTKKKMGKANKSKLIDWLLFPFDYAWRTNLFTPFFYFTEASLTNEQQFLDAKIKNTQWVIDGCFLGCLHFDEIETELRECLTFKPISKDDCKNNAAWNQIKAVNSVGIHVRRGDYYSSMHRRVVGDICDKSYFEEAVNRICLKVENPVFFVFSNDFDWVRQNLPGNQNYVYVDWNLGKNSFRDMQLMSYCKHQIICNSSFSWWAAWLNVNKQAIIVSPSKWINSFENKLVKLMVLKNWDIVEINAPFVSLIVDELLTELEISHFLSQTYTDFELLVRPEYLEDNCDIRIKSIVNKPCGKHTLMVDSSMLVGFSSKSELDKILRNFKY